jgi:hypothetical protein
MNNNLQINNQTSNKPSAPKYITQNDFIYFKNEFLKDLKKIESKLLSKLKSTTNQYETKISSMNSKINSFQTKILELSLSISSDNSKIECMNELFLFKSIIEEKSSSQEKKTKRIK